jgi:hypothetical protein
VLFVFAPFFNFEGFSFDSLLKGFINFAVDLLFEDWFKSGRWKFIEEAVARCFKRFISSELSNGFFPGKRFKLLVEFNPGNFSLFSSTG